MPDFLNRKHLERKAALVLAAGLSSRMGEFKPLLPVGGAPAVERVIGNFRSAGVRDVRVVVGHRREELIPVLHDLGAGVIENRDYRRGMFSSICEGAAALEPEVEAFFLAPVDIPGFRPLTVNLLAAAFEKDRTRAVRPVFSGRRGHPPLVSSVCIPEILDYEGEGGLKALLAGWAAETVEVWTPDRFCLLDMDRPDHYRDLASKMAHFDRLDAEERQALFQAIGIEAPDLGDPGAAPKPGRTTPEFTARDLLDQVSGNREAAELLGRALERMGCAGPGGGADPDRR